MLGRPWATDTEVAKVGKQVCTSQLNLPLCCILSVDPASSSGVSLTIASLSDALVMGGIVVVMTPDLPASSRKKSILAVLGAREGSRIPGALTTFGG